MNAPKRLLVLILSVAIILQVSVLAGCAGSGSSPAITTVTSTQAMPQLAFAGNRNGKYALFLINMDGSGEKQITDASEDIYHPSWSPDGKLIAAQTGGSRIVIMNTDGTNLKKLNTVFHQAYESDFTSPDFSPYGNLILSVQAQNTIFRVITGLNLGGQESLIFNSGVNTSKRALDNPSVSPDASMLAFDDSLSLPATGTSDGAGLGGAGIISSTQLNPVYVRRICVVDFDGTNLVQLTTSKEKYDDTYSTWSPDGKRIAFMSNRAGGKNQIYVMNADGTGQTQITNDTFENHDPAWSPDGAYIAYVSDHSGISELCIIRPDGTGRARVNRVNESVKTPSWRSLSGQALGVPPTISKPSTPPVTTKTPTGTTIPATNNSTTGRLNISCSGTNSPYSIYVNGALAGKGSATLNLAPGSYRVTIKNSKGTVVKDETSVVIAGKDSIVKVSGAG